MPDAEIIVGNSSHVCNLQYCEYRLPKVSITLLITGKVQMVCAFDQDVQMEQSKGRVINEWDMLDEILHRQEAAMPFSQFASRSSSIHLLLSVMGISAT